MVVMLLMNRGRAVVREFISARSLRVKANGKCQQTRPQTRGGTGVAASFFSSTTPGPNRDTWLFRFGLRAKSPRANQGNYSRWRRSLQPSSTLRPWTSVRTGSASFLSGRFRKAAGKAISSSSRTGPRSLRTNRRNDRVDDLRQARHIGSSGHYKSTKRAGLISFVQSHYPDITGGAASRIG